MSNIIYANKLQFEVLKSESRLTVITAEPGAGNTTALILKAIQSCNDKRIDCSFFIPHYITAKTKGGIVDQIFKYIDTTVRFSEKSLIFTFQNESKLKLIPCDSEVERTMGLSRDLMLFDSNIRDAFLIHHLPRAYEAVVVDNIRDIESEGSWANELNLIKMEDGVIKGFVDGVAHVKGRLLDNFFFDGREKYYGMAFKAIPEKFDLSFK